MTPTAKTPTAKTSTDNATPEEAEADLAELEQAAIDGEDVTVEQLTAAKERIGLLRLIKKGIDDRAAAKAAKDAIDLRAKTKTDVAAKFAARGSTDPKVAYQRAVAALETLVTAIEANNSLLTDTAEEYSRGGVVPLSWDQHRAEGFDGRNYAQVAQGNDVPYVVVAGETYRKENPAQWAQVALRKVARDHNLSTPGGTHLESMLTRDTPAAIEGLQ